MFEPTEVIRYDLSQEVLEQFAMFECGSKQQLACGLLVSIPDQHPDRRVDGLQSKANQSGLAYRRGRRRLLQHVIHAYSAIPS
jgi:hypothetical protein